MPSSRLARVLSESLGAESVRLVDVFRSVGLELEGAPMLVRVLGYRRKGTYVRPHIRRTGNRFTLTTMIGIPDVRQIQHVRAHWRRHDHVWRIKLPPGVYVHVQSYVRFLFRFPIYSILRRTFDLTKTELLKSALRIREAILRCATI